jgi:aminoglycoside 6'-N-acetyltransferase I
MSSPAVSIHVVSQANASLLDSVDEDVFDHEIRPELLSAFLANPANVLVVAVAETRVVGMASGISYVHPDKPLALFINEVGVSGRFHRQGIARQLFSRLLEKAKELGCSEAWVATELGNKSARALYEALGGVPDEEHAVVYVYPLKTEPPPSRNNGDAEPTGSASPKPPTRPTALNGITKGSMHTPSLQKPLLVVALGTVLVLLIPAVAMQFTSELNWSAGDFLVAGLLLFGAGAIAVMGLNQVRSTRYRVAVVLAVACGLGLIWAELAVGLFS